MGRRSLPFFCLLRCLLIAAGRYWEYHPFEVILVSLRFCWCRCLWSVPSYRWSCYRMLPWCCCLWLDYHIRIICWVWGHKDWLFSPSLYCHWSKVDCCTFEPLVLVSFQFAWNCWQWLPLYCWDCQEVYLLFRVWMAIIHLENLSIWILSLLHLFVQVCQTCSKWMPCYYWCY